MASDEIVGRERQLATIEAFLDTGSWPRALVLEGDPGIGKSTLWQTGHEMARARGLTVLTARPVEAEVSLAFGGLVDLFGYVPDEVFEALPGAQRHALAAALRRLTGVSMLPDPLAVSAGARALLARQAESCPLMIAIDDVQWLDSSSASVLAYVVRRLRGERIGLLLAHRTLTVGDTLPLGLGDRPPVDRVVVEPLSLSSLHHIIRARTGLSLSRPLLHRLAEVTMGNPLFAIGLATAIRDRGRTPSPGEPLPAPDTLLDFVAARVAKLPTTAREVLLAVASLGAPPPDLVATVLGESPDAALDLARDAGILDRDDDVLRFSHPLYAECVLGLAGVRRRRQMHSRIAAVLSEPEAHARHLALGSVPPDARVASALDAGAAAARARGALRAGAELLAEASRFAPPTDLVGVHQRAFAAAELLVLCGDRPSARALLDPIVTEAAEPLRGRAIGLHAELLASAGEVDRARRQLQDEAAAAVSDAVSARLHLDLAYVALLTFDVDTAATSAARAREAAARSGETAIQAEAIAYEALARTLAGRDVDAGSLEEALRLEDQSRPPYLGMPPSGNIGLIHALTAQHALARTLLGAARARLDAMGDDADLAHVLLWLSWLELRAGSLTDATVAAQDAAAVAETTGSPLLRAWAWAQMALVEATRGDEAATERAIGLAVRDGLGTDGVVGTWLATAAGLASLSVGDMSRAAATLGPPAEAAASAGIAEPVAAFFVPDAAEALARAGDLARADAVLRPFEAAALSRHRTWAIAVAARARAEILTAAGRTADALRLLRSSSLGGLEEMPLERARMDLAVGRIERRAGERRAARSSLHAAEVAFRSAGCAGWARLAADELRRVPGGRVTSGVLTPSERQVAELSGAGRTNREVAAALHLSPKTVEANLGRIYRKLGIATRAELGAWLASGGGPDQGL